MIHNIYNSSVYYFFTICCFATSKSSIVQSIGRVLRKQIKDGDTLPLVIDVADQLSCYPNQHKKRLTYYQNQGYVHETFYAFDNKLVSRMTYLAHDSDESEKQIIKDFPDLNKHDKKTPNLNDLLQVDISKINNETVDQVCKQTNKVKELDTTTFMFD